VIRIFLDTDLQDCKNIVNKVWKFTNVFQSREQAELALDSYTGGSLAESNYATVIEENGKIVGFLFGKYGVRKPLKTKYSGLYGRLSLLARLLFIGKVSLAEKFQYLRLINVHETNRHKAKANRDNEVNLFAVDPNTQGKGYGKVLMEAFIQRCKDEKVQSVTLDTDKECNFRFYEHFGYKKVAEFYSPIQEKYTGTDGTSFVYELSLESK
jgi:GNAT superfamily N-acetyltransferase